ncbi:Palmitoyltransferase [Mycena indigotica]|uniref:Palmitoyltransferase n=1 Tax=Mycena indigotica TaxID=2126181 RepID=A0A8H6S0W1_9AGAR|nr:Palmitoyltransferase [Mycena indigotica]KAF7290273.1 Palmitoyltransferase [Mycena indigotica]
MSGNGAPPTPPAPPKAKPTFCGTISEAAYTARERREARRERPQPWVVLKLMLPIVLGILGYAAYVYAGRFVRRLVAGGRDGLGVGLLVPWSVLWLWTVWAYVKVVSTPPGDACDYVAKSDRPLLPPTTWDDPQALEDIEAGRIGGPAYEQQARDRTEPIPIPPPPPIPPLPTRQSSKSLRPTRGRLPPTTAPLLPANRWCSRCKIVKPYRAHHCRACGTCVLKFDHHCPWIGQCVGARNHKFFLIFNLSAMLLGAYTFSSLLAVNVVDGGAIDPQEAVIVALSALFLLFTASLFFAHVRMILLTQTTVEGLVVRTLKDRESAQLASEGHPWWDVRGKRATLRTYDAEWGAPDTEGNLWWPGSYRAAWEDVMGAGWLGWILPIGRAGSDGRAYAPNPRFDRDGRWRRRAEWPEELR